MIIYTYWSACGLALGPLTVPSIQTYLTEGVITSPIAWSSRRSPTMEADVMGLEPLHRHMPAGCTWTRLDFGDFSMTQDFSLSLSLDHFLTSFYYYLPCTFSRKSHLSTISIIYFLNFIKWGSWRNKQTKDRLGMRYQLHHTRFMHLLKVLLNLVLLFHCFVKWPHEKFIQTIMVCFIHSCHFAMAIIPCTIQYILVVYLFIVCIC